MNRRNASLVGLSLALMIVMPSAAWALSPEMQRVLGVKSLEEAEEAFLQSKMRAWAPRGGGEFVQLPALKIQRIRAETPGSCSGRPCPDFTVVLTLGVSPSAEHPAVKEAFFHLPTLLEAMTAVNDLKAGKIKGLWLQRHEVTGGKKGSLWEGPAGSWWAILGLEY